MELENNDGSVFLGEEKESVENNRFPEGMRVLAVDDNFLCLKTLVALLEKCRYKVHATTNAAEALQLLRENKDSFDIVITDVIMPEMDGFTLMELISLEIKDLPVIMLSAYDDRNNVMKGIESGAQVYLLKPPRLEEIKNIWQHVVRKNLSHAKNNNRPTIPKVAVLSKDSVPRPALKRKADRVEEGEEPNKESKSDKTSTPKKKRRVQWTERIHAKFLDAVQRLGVDDAVPKRILQIMNEPGLSRENIASHLQKYRKSREKEKKRENADSNNSGGVSSQRAACPSSVNPPTATVANRQGRPELQGRMIVPTGNGMAPTRNQMYSANNNSNSNLVQPNQQDSFVHQTQLQQGTHLEANLNLPKARFTGFGSIPGTVPWVHNPSDHRWLQYQNYRSYRLQSQHGGEDIRKPVFTQTPSYGGSWEPGSSSACPVRCGPSPVQLDGPGLEQVGLSHQMLGNGNASGMSRSAANNNSAVTLPNFPPPAVKNEGGSYFNSNGGGGEVDCRGITHARPLNMQGPAMEINPIQYGRNSFGYIVQDNMDEENISTLVDALMDGEAAPQL